MREIKEGGRKVWKRGKQARKGRKEVREKLGRAKANKVINTGVSTHLFRVSCRKQTKRNNSHVKTGLYKEDLQPHSN